MLDDLSLLSPRVQTQEAAALAVNSAAPFDPAARQTIVDSCLELSGVHRLLVGPQHKVLGAAGKSFGRDVG